MIILFESQLLGGTVPLKNRIVMAPMTRTRTWCGGFTDREGAQTALDTGLVDLIAFGRPYIANSDLADRLKHGWPVAEADRSAYYTRRGEIGYTDFSAYPDR